MSLVAGVHWFSRIEDETLLKNLGVSYGFYGVGKEDFRCHCVRQVHGTTIVEAGDATVGPHTESVHADGIYSQKKGLTVGVQTADCVPILLCTADRMIVMALHAGWRGLCAGIVGEGVRKLRSLAPSSAIFACIGPSIGVCHYEVGPEVIEAVHGPQLGLSEDQFRECVLPGKGDRSYLDLTTTTVFTLMNSLIPANHISALRSCTYEHPELWHSYRRDAKAAKRNWSWICA